jgi:hypothetical protein
MSKPVSQEVNADDMLRMITGSLQGYPHAGGDIGVMAEVDRIVKEALAEQSRTISRLRGLIDKARRNTASDPDNIWCRQATIILNQALATTAATEPQK